MNINLIDIFLYIVALMLVFSLILVFGGCASIERPYLNPHRLSLQHNF